jgi:toxin CptA
VLLVFALALAFVAGFSLQRGHICAVAGVREVMREGRWARFLSFFECAMWALLGLIVVDAMGWMSLGAWPQQASIAMAIMGGAVFGAGALVNGACAFGSAGRFAAGELSFLALIPGFVLGVAAAGGLGWMVMAPAQSAALLLSGVMRAVVLAALVMFALLRLWNAWRAAPSFSHIRAVIVAPHWPPALAMAVIAFANVALLVLVFAWPYTTLLVDVAFMRGMDVALRTMIVLVFLAGALYGAASAGRFKLRGGGWRDAGQRFGGGVLMGFGAALIPGGNDGLVLMGLPLLQPAAFAAYGAMIAVIAAGFAVEPRVREYSA